MSIAHGNTQTIKETMQLGIVSSEIYQSRAFLLDKVLDGIVVVALVLASENKHHLGLHALKGIPTGIHISCL